MSRLGTETAFEVLVRARALEAQGKDVVHLEVGEPDFDTPAERDRGRGRRAPDRLDPLRTSQWRSRAARSRSPPTSTAPSSLDYRRDQVVVTPGGKPVMFFLILALLAGR